MNGGARGVEQVSRRAEATHRPRNWTAPLQERYTTERPKSRMHPQSPPSSPPSSCASSHAGSSQSRTRARGRARAAAIGSLAVALVAAGCSHAQRAEDNAKPPAPAEDAGPAPKPQASAEQAGPADAGVYTGPYLAALFMQSPIMSDMEWPLPETATRRDRDANPARANVVRIGYIRRGGKVPVIPEAHKKSNCTDGWYELVAGGFVCGKYATLDMNHPRVRLAPHPPFMDQALPYVYGYNLTNGTPLYRHIPSREERLQLEPWLSAKARPRRGIEEDNPYADLDAGAAQAPAPVATAAPIVTATTTDPFGAAGEPTEPATPWYLREWDGGKPQVTLDELQEGDGPVLRRMVRGFYLALDKEEKDNLKVKWWKTTGGDIAPYDRIYVNKSVSDFHGVWLNDAAHPTVPTTAGNPPSGDAGAEAPPIAIATHLPLGFILWSGHKYTLSEDKKKAIRGDEIPRFTSVQLTGERVVVGGRAYELTEEGWYMRESDGQIARATPPPKDLAPNEKWIDVNLKTQTLVAYEGEKAVYATVVSSGKKSEIKEKNHETKPGTFRIREKHIAATMDGDVATDGPYSIEDVPWIMYFNQSIALHGAFWHSNFGHQKSHGCVNLSPLDARAMFAWTDPPLPDGWHGVMATPERPGTRVIVRDPDQPRNGI